MAKKLLLVLVLAFAFAYIAKTKNMLFTTHEFWNNVSGVISKKAASEPKEPELALDFVLPDNNGNEIKLSSLRGKCVILHFWGTWCTWCVKGMPKMKQYYEKYKDKVEIVAVDTGDSPMKWKAAVQVLKLPWTNVQEGRDKSVTKQYKIKNYPANIFIDEKGYIVKVIEGDDPRFYTVMDDMFK